MIAFVCRGGGELDITQGEVRGAGFTPHRHKLTTSKRTQIRSHGVTTTVMTHRLGLNAKLPPEDSIFIPVLGPEGGGLSSSVREYSMEADGLAQGGYSMKPDGDFELITATLDTLITGEQNVFVWWRSTLYRHGQHMSLSVSFLMFRALMTLKYWQEVRISVTTCRNTNVTTSQPIRLMAPIAPLPAGLEERRQHTFTMGHLHR